MYLKALAIVLSIGFFSTSQVAASVPAPRLEQIWVSRGFSSPEGVAVVGDTLLISNVAGDATEKDGVAALGHGSFLVSSWTGRIWHVGPCGTVTSILETEAEGINQNDLTGVGSLIVVPNWSPGTVTAWRVVTTDGAAN